jgi:tRNA(Ile)-lysidine synthase
LHLVRGSGLAGLGGIALRSRWPFAGHDQLALVRPLLRLTREDTTSYCRACGLEPVEDESNRSHDFLRNRVRHELMPALASFNPAIEAALTRLAAAAREDVSFLSEVAAEAIVASGAQAVSLSRPLVAGWPASPRRHALRLAVKALLGDAEGFAERHLLALERLVLSGVTGAHLDLPRGMTAALSRDLLVLSLSSQPTVERLPPATVRLTVPGEVRLGPVLASAGSRVAGAGWTAAEVDSEAVGGELSVRRRSPGDRFQPLGMTGTKKLQDFFVDEHVARGERDAVPLFETARGIVWVGGLRIAEWARPRPGRATLTLAFRCEE